MAYSIVKDLDLDESSEYETDALGDSNLFYLMRVSILVVLFFFFMYCFDANHLSSTRLL